MIFYDIPKKPEPIVEEKESVVSLPALDLDAVEIEVEDDGEAVELPAPEEDDVDEVEDVEPVELPAPKLTIQALFDRLRLQVRSQ